MHLIQNMSFIRLKIIVLFSIKQNYTKAWIWFRVARVAAVLALMFKQF